MLSKCSCHYRRGWRNTRDSDTSSWWWRWVRRRLPVPGIGWGRRDLLLELITRNLIAFGIHALLIGDVISPLSIPPCRLPLFLYSPPAPTAPHTPTHTHS